MKVLDCTTRAYRLDGNSVSDESLDIVLNAAYAMLAKNDELAPPFEEWEVSAEDDGDAVLRYSAITDVGNEIGITFNFADLTARIVLGSPEEECYIGDVLLCTISGTEVRYPTEEWL